jgi:hypothetical protein
MTTDWINTERAFNKAEGSRRRTMSLIYREIYVGCGERQDGRWNVIVIPPGGAR